MATFHLYENQPNNRARIHRDNCVFCNYGQGRPGRTDENGTWHGSFSTIQQALGEMIKIGKSDSAACGTCFDAKFVARVAELWALQFSIPS